MKKKPGRGLRSTREGFVLHRLGREWLAREDRPYKPDDWGRIDLDLYGSDPHR